jgi:ribosomal protein L29
MANETLEQAQARANMAEKRITQLEKELAELKEKLSQLRVRWVKHAIEQALADGRHHRLSELTGRCGMA